MIGFGRNGNPICRGTREPSPSPNQEKRATQDEVRAELGVEVTRLPKRLGSRIRYGRVSRETRSDVKAALAAQEIKDHHLDLPVLQDELSPTAEISKNTSAGIPTEIAEPTLFTQVNELAAYTDKRTRNASPDEKAYEKAQEVARQQHHAGQKTPQSQYIWTGDEFSPEALAAADLEFGSTPDEVSREVASQLRRSAEGIAASNHLNRYKLQNPADQTTPFEQLGECTRTVLPKPPESGTFIRRPLKSSHGSSGRSSHKR